MITKNSLSFGTGNPYLEKPVIEPKVSVFIIEKYDTIQKPKHVTKSSFNLINFKNRGSNLSIALALSETGKFCEIFKNNFFT